MIIVIVKLEIYYKIKLVGDWKMMFKLKHQSVPTHSTDELDLF